MRTTVTLDDDVAAWLERRRRLSQSTFKEVINEALRAGLVALERPSEEQPNKAWDVVDAQPLLPSYDCTGEIETYLDAEDQRP